MREVLTEDAPVENLPDLDGLDQVAARLREMLETRAMRLNLPAAEGGR